MPSHNRPDQLVLLLGDIHANEAALAAVLNDARRRYPGRRLPIWFLGDLFGRGPRPAGAWRLLMAEEPEAMIMGNHEGGLIGLYENPPAGGLYNGSDWEVLLRHREKLHDLGLLACVGGRVGGGEVVEVVSRWPAICAPRPSIYMVHGGLERAFEPPAPGRFAELRNRLVWEYVKKKAHADHTLTALRWIAANPPNDPAVALWPGGPAEPELALVGHWHTRLFYDQEDGKLLNPVDLDMPYQLEGRTVLLSPGSVGFPRQNGELDASYCVLHIRNNRPFQAVFHRCAYDRAAVRNEMVRHGYPSETVKRLRLSGETETARSGAPRPLRGCAPEGEE